MIGRERADLAASGVVFEPAPSRLGNSLPGREQRLRCRLPETDKDVGVGKLDLPADRFDGIFANASLFHVPRQELPRVLSELRASLPEATAPPLALCTDNAAMIASAARYGEAIPPPGYLALDAYASAL